MEIDAGLDIFISVLLRYPEFNAVKYDAANEEIKVEVALQGGIKQETQDKFRSELDQCIILFGKLSKSKTSYINISFEEYRQSKLTILRYKREVESLTEGEVEIFASLLQKHFNKSIISDSGKIITEDGFKKKVKANLLHKINREKTGVSNFLAYRDQGRVLVFNK